MNNYSIINNSVKINCLILICMIQIRRVEESEIRKSIVPKIEKFDSIVSELKRREVVVLMNRPTRWGYVVDAVIPSLKVVILKLPDLSRQGKVAMSMFRDFTSRLEGDGYRVIIIPKHSMDEAQIKAFCDLISIEPALAAA